MTDYLNSIYSNKRSALQYDGLMHSNLLNLELEDDGIHSFEMESNVNVEMDDFEGQVKNTRLGKRVEDLFLIYINHSKRYEVLAKNIQIFKNKETLGELDYILFDKESNNPIHVELSYKFYCYDPSLGMDELDRWIGPNRKDCLVYKRDKLRKKQFPLLYKEETNLALIPFSIEQEKITQQLCYFAQLFVPYAFKDNEFPFVNRDCIVGYVDNYNSFMANVDKSDTYYVPRKHDWLIDPAINLSWYSFDMIAPILHESCDSKQSILIWVKRANQTFDKVFLVWWECNPS